MLRFVWWLALGRLWSRLGVWLLYISLCGCVCASGLRWGRVGSRLMPSPNEAAWWERVAGSSEHKMFCVN